MQKKYESPQLEIYKFSLNVQAVTNSNTQETQINTGGEIGGGEGGYNPFG